MNHEHAVPLGELTSVTAPGRPARLDGLDHLVLLLFYGSLMLL